MSDKTIYDLELHEEIKIETKFIMRVPGGWLYTDTRGQSAVSHFVPYHNEFNKKRPKYMWDLSEKEHDDIRFGDNPEQFKITCNNTQDE